MQFRSGVCTSQIKGPTLVLSFSFHTQTILKVSGLFKLVAKALVIVFQKQEAGREN